MSFGSMETGMPPVSVVIAAYNSGRYLPESLGSVFRQSYRPCEIIVVDDGSTDGTKEVLAGYGDRVAAIHQPNRGPSAARNAGIRASKGEYICFLDADDLWHENKLETEVQWLKRNPRAGLVFSDMEEFDENGTRAESLIGKSIFKDEIMTGLPIQGAAGKLLIENFIPTSSVMVRRPCFDRAGLFDESLRASEDRELWSRIAALFEIACVPLVLGKKRAHESNLSSNVEVTLRARIRMWEDARRAKSRALPAAALAYLLADAYLFLGYVLLNGGRREEARRAAIQSLRHAVKSLKGSKSNSRVSYRWSLALCLVPLTFIHGRMTRKVWQLRNRALGHVSS